MRARLYWVPFLLLATLNPGCKDSVVIQPLTQDLAGEEGKKEEQKRIFIVDRTGKKWDITHAVEKYGFDPDKFEYGLGPMAIPPILNPEMLSPGDDGYPQDTGRFTILGTELNGDVRAYPLTVMIRHEIVNEQFGDAHVAVAY